FVHVGVIFQAPLPRQTQLIADPLVRIRYGNASWSERTFEIWMFKWSALVWSFDQISESARRAVCAREPWRDMSRLAAFKARGHSTSRAYAQWLKDKSLSTLAALAVWALAAFSGPLFYHLLPTLSTIPPLS